MTASRPEPAARLEVLRAGPAHAEIVAGFFRAIWTPTATAEAVSQAWKRGAAANVAEPGVAPPTWIAVRGGVVLGYVTTIPIRIWDGRRDLPAYWIKGLMVLPEFRNGPIGFAVLKAAVASLPRTGALAVAPPARRLFTALGYADLGPIRNWVRPLSPGSLLERLDLSGEALASLPAPVARGARLLQRSGIGVSLADGCGSLLGAGAATVRVVANGGVADTVEPRDVLPGLDALWSAARRRRPRAVVRDSRYLGERYGAPNGPYQWVAVRERGTVVGVAIVRHPQPEGEQRLWGARLATLADILYPSGRPEVGLALLGGVERVAREGGADAVLASASSPELARVLRWQCYLPMGGNVHLLIRDASGESADLAGTLEDWWLTRGDGAADDMF